MHNMKHVFAHHPQGFLKSLRNDTVFQVRTFSNSTHLLAGGTIGDDLQEAADAIDDLAASQNPGTSLYRVTYNCLDWLHRRQVCV